jgi:RimJ/RimL family protein N-acetyltransferase
MTGTTVHIPTLQTDRLIPRAHRLSDKASNAAALASERFRRMTRDRSRGHAWASFTGDVASWRLHGFGVWTVDRKDGTPVARVGLNRPECFPEPEIGWLVHNGHEGNGDAVEAASAALHRASDQGVETLVRSITPQNVRSITLAKRLCAAHDPDAPRPDGESAEETVVYRHRSDRDGSPDADA